jgi:hypothetical protein
VDEEMKILNVKCLLWLLSLPMLGFVFFAAQEHTPTEQEMKGAFPSKAPYSPNANGARVLGRHSPAYLVLDGCGCIWVPTDTFPLHRSSAQPCCLARAILAGLHDAISQRVLALLRGVGIAEKFVITGGIGKNVGVVTKIGEKLDGIQIIVQEEPQIAGPWGRLCSPSTAQERRP